MDRHAVAGILTAALVVSRATPAQVEYDRAGLARGPAPSGGGSPPPRRAPVIEERVFRALAEFEGRHGRAEKEFGQGGGFPRSLRGFRATRFRPPLTDADPTVTHPAAAQALGFVESERQVLGLDPSDGFLEPSVHAFEDLTIVRMEQLHGGLPVLGGGLTVHIDRDGAVCALLVNLRRDVPDLPAQAVPAQAAAASATARFEGRGSGPASRAVSSRLAIARIGARYRKVWDVRLSTPIGPYRVLVDAASGEAIGNGSLLGSVNCFPRPEGLVYAESPVKGEPARVTLEDLACTSDRLLGEFVRSFDWGGTDFFGDPIPELGIRGTLVSNRVLFEAATGPELAQVSVYHHATGFHDYMGRVGFHGLDRPFPAIVNAPECYGEVPCRNALYNPLYEHATGFGAIIFGVSPEVNFGLEADVVCHEYTHGVVDGTSQLGIDYFDPSAFYSLGLNEAFADYFSSSYIGDPHLGEYTGPQVLGRPSLRTLDNALKWPDDIDPSSFHDTGQIWGGTLWDVRQALSAGGTDPVAVLRADRLAYATLVSLSSNAAFVNAADALLASASSGGFSPAEISTIRSILEARGLQAPAGESPFQVRRHVPGTQVIGQVAAAPPGSVRLGTIQYEIIVPADALSLRLKLEGSGNIDLHASHDTLVSLNGSQVEDTAASEGPGASEVVTLVRDGGLLPGSWFVAVSNRTPQVADYTLEAELAISTFESILPLAPGTRVDGSIPGGTSLSSVAYSIAPGDVTGRKLVLSLGATGNADLYVRRGVPVELGLEGRIVADARLHFPADGESLTLDSLSIPALEPVTYYAAVWNATEGAVSYSLAAAIGNFTAPSLEEASLVPDTPLAGMVPAASPGTSRIHAVQFTVLVPDDGSRLVIDASASGDLGVFLRRGARVAFEDGHLVYDHGSDLPGTGNERVAIDLFSQPRIEGGLYYVAVLGRETEPTPFEISALVETIAVTSTVQDLPPRTFVETVVEPSNPGESGKLSAVQFRMEVDATSRGLDVISIPGSAGNVDLYLRRTRPVQMIAGRVVADYHAETESGAESITILPPDLIPGTYHAALVNRSTAAVSMEVLALYEADYPGTILVDEDSIWRSVMNPPGPGFDCALGIQQFGVTVPPNALRLEVDAALLTSGPLEVLSRFGSRITIDQGQVISDKSTLITDQSLILYSGADLRPGTYFFALRNCTTAQQAILLRRYMKVTGATEEHVYNDIGKTGTVDPATEEGAWLHPTQFYFDVVLDAKQAVLSVLGPECEDSGLDLLVNLGSRVTLEPDGTTNARWRTSGRGRADTLVLGSGSVPPIAPGRYYVGMANNTPERRPFTLLATRSLEESVELESGSPALDTVEMSGEPGVGLLQGFQYRIDAPPGSAALVFSLQPTGSPDSNIDLHVRLGAPVRVYGGELMTDWTSTREGGVEEIRLTAGDHCLGGSYFVVVSNLSQAAVEYSLTATVDRASLSALPGDSDETGDLTITDAIATLNFLFIGGRTVCEEAADVDGDGSLNITDPVNLLSYLFLGREPPRAPFPDCGPLEQAGSCSGAGCE